MSRLNGETVVHAAILRFLRRSMFFRLWIILAAQKCRWGTTSGGNKDEGKGHHFWLWFSRQITREEIFTFLVIPSLFLSRPRLLSCECFFPARECRNDHPHVNGIHTFCENLCTSDRLEFDLLSHNETLYIVSIIRSHLSDYVRFSSAALTLPFSFHYIRQAFTFIFTGSFPPYTLHTSLLPYSGLPQTQQTKVESLRATHEGRSSHPENI